MSYANESELRLVGRVYCIDVPTNHDEVAALLDAATRDVDRYLGVPGGYDTTMLHAEQGEALRDATAIQVLFRIEQGSLMLGSDDGIASVSGMSFSLRALPRFSREAADRLTGMGLYRRTGSLPLDDATPAA